MPRTAIKDNRRDGAESDESGGGPGAGEEEEADNEEGDDEPGEEEDTNEDPTYRERMRMKRFSSSALCLNDHKLQRGHQQQHQQQQHRHHKRHQQHDSRLADNDKHLGLNDGHKYRDSPKRPILGSKFKSKPHEQLNDQDKARDVSGNRTKTQLARKQHKDQQQQQQSSSVNLLHPEDPIVQLARQRRPSVSNQGSVNVDQQGEC